MRKQIKNRFWTIVLFAALAVMFWFFDLSILAWIFGALVLVPLVIGFFIWIFKGLTSQTVVHESEGYGAYQPNRDNTTEPPAKCDHKFKLVRWDDEFPAGLVKCTKCNKETRAVGK